MKNIPYGRHNITDEDISAVVAILKSDNLTQGKTIGEFEKYFAEYAGAKYAVAVSNGTAALHLSAIVMGIKPGDKVITTPITFVASANCIRYCGGDVHFCDIDPETYCLSEDEVYKTLKKYPKGTFKGIIPVDFAGYPVNLEKFREIADEFGLWIIEDACHAPGGYFIDSKGVKQNCGNGNYAGLAIFSFHPVKHIACGEGGMVTTNNESFYKRLLNLRTHGIQQDYSLNHENLGPWYYEMQELGYNYRLTDIQAALGISQLKRAQKGLARRIEIAGIYTKAFAGTPVITPKVSDNVKHAYHLYVIKTEKRFELYNYLRTKQIYAQVHYIPVHFQYYYKQFGWKKGDFPVAEKFYEQCLSIPVYPTLTADEQEFVCKTINDFFA